MACCISLLKIKLSTHEKPCNQMDRIHSFGHYKSWGLTEFPDNFIIGLYFLPVSCGDCTPHLCTFRICDNLWYLEVSAIDTINSRHLGNSKPRCCTRWSIRLCISNNDILSGSYINGNYNRNLNICPSLVHSQDQS